MTNDPNLSGSNVPHRDPVGHQTGSHEVEPAEKSGGSPLKWLLIALGVLLAIALILALLGVFSDDEEDDTDNVSDAATSSEVVTSEAEASTAATSSPMAPAEGQAEGQDEQVIRFEAYTSDGALMDITSTDDTLNIGQNIGMESPWTTEYTIGADEPINVNFSAQTQGSGTVSCKIFVNEELVTFEEKTGEQAVANCGQIS